MDHPAAINNLNIRPSVLARLAWLLLAVLLAGMAALWAADLRQSYESASLLFAMNFTFTTMASVFIAFLAGRSFLSSGQPGLLMMCCALMIWGASAFVAGISSHVGNYNITIHNLGVCLSAVCHLTGAVLTIRTRRPLQSPAGMLAVGCVGAMFGVGLILLATAEGWLPVFFVNGQGGTPVRTGVLSLSIILFGITAALMWLHQRRNPSEFLRWYAIGLAMLGAGALGLMFQSVHGGWLGWTARSTQYLGGMYMLVGAMFAVRESRAWELPLAVALEKAKDEYELLFQSINDGILLHEVGAGASSKKFLRANDVLCRLLGYSREEIHQLTPRQIIAPKERAAQPANSTPFAPDAAEERMLLSKDGRSILAEVNTRVFDHRGQRMALSVIRDITERKAAEEALREGDRRKNEFLAILAHELRNPLAPLRSALEIIKRADGDADLVEQARSTMERQIKQMVRLIDDLLDVSRITRNKLELRLERVELASVIHQAVEACRPLADRANHEIEITLPPEPVYLNADPARLAQVFGNLLSNACKYAEKPGRIGLIVKRADGEVVVTVKDTGIGIPPELLPKVFDMFMQVDGSLGRAQGGLGIGLTMVKQLVEMHNGSVTAYSAGIGHGSEFTVRLPALAETLETPPPPAPANEFNSTTARRVLVVDDNEDSASMMATIVKLAGNQVLMAHDGLEGIEKAAAYKPEVILLDIGLPKMDGYDVCRAIREQPWGKDIIIVALTGWGQDEDRRKSKEAGFDDHLVKPVDPIVIEQLLASRQSPVAQFDGR